jgi:hypothetical protein
MGEQLSLEEVRAQAPTCTPSRTRMSALVRLRLQARRTDRRKRPLAAGANVSAGRRQRTTSEKTPSARLLESAKIARVRSTVFERRKAQQTLTRNQLEARQVHPVHALPPHVPLSGLDPHELSRLSAAGEREAVQIWW